MIFFKWQVLLTLYKVKLLSRVRFFATPWTVAHQAPPSIGFSRQEYWSGLPFPSPGELTEPAIEPRFPALQADALPTEVPGKPRQWAQPPANWALSRWGLEATSSDSSNYRNQTVDTNYAPGWRGDSGCARARQLCIS